MHLRGFGRLGLTELAQDHARTWVEQDEHRKSHRSRADWRLFVGLPVISAVVVALLGIRLRSVDALLTGVSIITGLLFGLLIHILTLGLRIAEDDKIPAGSRIAVLTSELRANVAWACAVGLGISALLAITDSFVVNMSKQGLHPALTGVAIGLLLHLGLTLLAILKRVRSTYNMLGK